MRAKNTGSGYIFFFPGAPLRIRSTSDVSSKAWTLLIGDGHIINKSYYSFWVGKVPLEEVYLSYFVWNFLFLTN